MDRSRPYPIWPFIFTVIFCFRGYMEWKYIRETLRRHQVSILLAAASLSFTGLMILILLVKILNQESNQEEMSRRWVGYNVIRCLDMDFIIGRGNQS
ncbi:DUF4181 domain-containing protein [Paenibacillus sp. EZ-K15]|uniref:DUF4181 domain-containing protein n=1 Tax=Paenibacillus sp. EZ-K15 TaxID=2044275 RepID=UPI001F45D18E|nr:DUF4181 domain-containing protein [Paenibacillus sp. EZ-K15]